MQRTLLLGIMVAQLCACATGDYAKIDEVYLANMEQCQDMNSDFRQVYTRQQCETIVTEIRDKSNRNKNNLFRRLFQGGGGAGDVGYIIILN